ncbi:Ran GTPase-activating protein 1 [Trichoplax sp. H2]|nr:Ran GTPase-activating protein 1 [Trichoplax sp. H2]|eukprot:RDD46836.1 Ran GTPase-activating protein 1 [Trichoplax sp. H2]
MTDLTDITNLLSKTKVQQLNEVDFSNKGLKLNNGEDASEVVNAIKQCKDLQALRLSGNTIGVEAAVVIADALKDRKELERAYWSDIFTGRLRSEIPLALESLSKAVFTAQASLVEIDLSDNAFGPDGINAVKSLLSGRPGYTIKTLKLNNNGLGPNGGKILAAALRECYKNSGDKFSLKTFICGRNRLEIAGSEALASAFKIIGTLEDVSMPQNGIKSEGIVPLVCALACNKSLKRLNLNDNIFSQDGSKALAEAMANWPYLQYLNVGDCLLGSDGAIAIANVIEKHNPNLQEVLVDSNDIETDAAIKLATALKNCSSLQKLDINANCFGSKGIEELKHCIEGSVVADSLCSLSDDEGLLDEAEDDSDASDAEEEPGDDTTGKLIEDSELHVTGKSVTPDASPRSLNTHQDFSDYEEIVRKFLNISRPLSAADDRSQKEIYRNIDMLLSSICISSTFESEKFTTTLLIHMGLLKSEDKKFRCVVDDLNGPMIALRYVAKQSYFPKQIIPILKAFINKPNEKLDKCGESKHLLMQTLFQV